MLENLKQTLLTAISESGISDVVVETLKPLSLDSGNIITKMNSMRVFLQQSLKASENFAVISEILGYIDDTTDLAQEEAAEVKETIFQELKRILAGAGVQTVGFFQGLPVSLGSTVSDGIETVGLYLSDTIDGVDTRAAALFEITRRSAIDISYEFIEATKSFVSGTAKDVMCTIDSVIDVVSTTSTDLMAAVELMSYSMTKNIIPSSHIHNILNNANSGPLVTSIKSVIATVDSLSPVNVFQMVYDFIHSSIRHDDGNSYEVIAMPGFNSNILGMMVDGLLDVIQAALSAVTGWIGVVLNVLAGIGRAVFTGLTMLSGTTAEIANFLTLTPTWNVPLTPAFPMTVTRPAMIEEINSILDEFGIAAITVGNQIGAYYIVYGRTGEATSTSQGYNVQLIASGATTDVFPPTVSIAGTQPYVLRTRYDLDTENEYNPAENLTDPAMYYYSTQNDDQMWRQLIFNLSCFLSCGTPITFDLSNSVYNANMNVSFDGLSNNLKTLFKPVLDEPDYATAKQMYQTRWMFLAGVYGSLVWKNDSYKELKEPNYEALYEIIGNERFASFNREIGLLVLRPGQEPFDGFTQYRPFWGGYRVIPGSTAYEPALIYPSTSRTSLITAIVLTTATVAAVAAGVGLAKRAHVRRRRAKYSIAKGKRDAAAANYLSNPSKATFNALTKADGKVARQAKLCAKAGISPANIDFDPAALSIGSESGESFFGGELIPDYSVVKTIDQEVKELREQVSNLRALIKLD